MAGIFDQFDGEYRGSEKVIGVINTDRGLLEQPPILNTNELIRSPLMSTNIYTPTHTPEELEEFLPGLRESMQNFDINDCDIEQIEDSFGENNNMYGLKHLPESIQLMREASTGVIPTTETRRKLSEFNTGKTLSPEHRKKISESHFGIRPSAESRKKMSEAKKGKTLSPEHRKKISEVRKGKPATSSGMKGKNHTPEAKKNISKAKKIYWTEERRQTYSETMKLWHAKRKQTKKKLL